ncbi:hypothetical protein [Flavivirga aquatica]|uniref:hypothetical protein n=1 Tax=Flavivirga aquatica TaxID=1849968 RepID=UPI0013F4F824|nr:hypothetical protein [Flavivirga aquatica]
MFIINITNVFDPEIELEKIAAIIVEENSIKGMALTSTKFATTEGTIVFFFTK